MLRLVLGIWFLAALLVGATGRLAGSELPPPAFALLITIVLVMGVWLVPGLRQPVQHLGPGTLVAFHLCRLPIGAYFLLLAHRGELPDAFALPAGWGDIVVGLAAIPVLMFCLPAFTGGDRMGFLAWNALGLLDILLVLGNGMRLLGREPGMAEPFTRLPLAILPLFVVPIVISTHLWLFAWLPSRRPTGMPDEPVGPRIPPPEDLEPPP